MGGSLCLTSLGDEGALHVPMTLLSAAACGGGSVLFTSKWIEGFPRKKSSCFPALVALGFLVAAFVYFGCSFFPPTTRIATVASLPCIAGLLVLWADGMSSGKRMEAFSGEELACEAEIERGFGKRYMISLVIGVSAFGFVGTLVPLSKGFATLFADAIGAETARMDWQNAGMAAFSGMFLLFAAVSAARGRNIASNSFSRLMLGATCVALVVPCLFREIPYFATIFVVNGSMVVLEILIVSYSAVYAQHERIPVYRPFNLFYALLEGMSVVGCLLCSVALPVLSEGLSTDMVLVIVLTLVLVVLFLLIPAEAALQKTLFAERPSAAPLDPSMMHNVSHKHNIDALAEHLGAKYDLTPREREIALLLSQGRSLPYIQEKLSIAEGTARTHVAHIYQKLGVHSRQEFLDLVEQFSAPLEYCAPSDSGSVFEKRN